MTAVEKLVRLLDKMDEQRTEINRLRERNDELEVLLRSAIQELAIAVEELPSRYRRIWLSLHDPEMLRHRGLTS